jgi:hypothetical protein
MLEGVEMTIQTIEEALAGMGQALSRAGLAQRARDAVRGGDVLEVTILVAPAKGGVTVTMHSLIARDRQSHGRLIKLK